MFIGQAAKVLKVRCQNGIKEVQLGETDPKDPTFKYDPPTNVSFGNLPLVRDPMEDLLVKTGPSKLYQAGDGVFAARDIPEPGR